MKSWKSMTRAERRVAIAKDVIKRIHAGEISTTEGLFLSPKSNKKYVPLVDLSKYEGNSYWCYSDNRIKYTPRRLEPHEAEILLKKCRVCAAGALMLVKTARYNDTVITRPINSDEACDETLKGSFTEKHLGRIIQAFDNDWLDDFPDEVYRMLAIMQNIIDHKGAFKPNVRYEIAGK